MRNVRLFRVPLNANGYDSQGQYHGIHPKDLYYAQSSTGKISEDYTEYIRAGSRREAMEALELSPEQLTSRKGLGG